jgi:ribosomal protein S9
VSPNVVEGRVAVDRRGQVDEQPDANAGQQYQTAEATHYVELLRLRVAVRGGTITCEVTVSRNGLARSYVEAMTMGLKERAKIADLRGFQTR